MTKSAALRAIHSKFVNLLQQAKQRKCVQQPYASVKTTIENDCKKLEKQISNRAGTQELKIFSTNFIGQLVSKFSYKFIIEFTTNNPNKNCDILQINM